MTSTETSFQTSDGLALFARRWLPAGEPRAAVAVLHGLAEHSGRYDHLARFLTGRGIAVHAFDGRAHGRSPGANAFIPSLDRYLEDVDHFMDMVKVASGNLPLFLFGHSMGGEIATLWSIERRPDDLAGLLLSGPAVAPGTDISPLMIRLAPLLGRLAPRLPTVKLDSEAISRDPAVVQAYDGDPLCYRGGTPARTGAELLQGIMRIQAGMEALHLPLLVMHGTADRLTNPAGSRQLHERAGTADKTLKLYEGFYHELINEPGKEQVMNDMLAWIEARI